MASEKNDRKEEDVLQDVQVLSPVVDDVVADDHDYSSKDSNLGEKATPVRSRDDDWEKDEKYDPADDDFNGHIIRTGADVSNYLMSIRDDGDPSLTLRSFIIGSIMTAFSSSVTQIWAFKPAGGGFSTSFMIMIIWFLGRGWTFILPRGDKLERKWRDKHGEEARLPWWIKAAKFLNDGEFGLKEHAVATLFASSSSNGTAAINVFTVQDLFYDLKLSGTTVALSTLSISLFGYGLTGLLRPITVWHPEAVYWSNLPIVKILQGLHWHKVRDSKPLRYFWYALASMSVYEVFPLYVIPWLNSVSIPCLASMHVKGSRAQVLTNIFGGSLSNEGMGLLNLTFDWNSIGSGSLVMPMKYQVNCLIGILICYVAVVSVYYGNAWNSRSLPFMSSLLRTQDGKPYKTSKVFVNGILDQSKLADYGLPRVAGSYLWGMLCGNIAIGALFAHCLLFWGPDIVAVVKNLRKGKYDDRHHGAMSKYKEAPWYWYAGMLIFAFVLGMIVVTTQDVTLNAWTYVVALILGIAIAPLSTLLFSRFGNGIATNTLMKMVAGACMPGRPLANLYFSAWSHSVISQSLNLASDLKLGEYLKIPPRTMFITQVYGTVGGAFISYAVMRAIVDNKRDILLDPNGNYAWSGQGFQSLNNQATTWALSKYLYSAGKPYFLIPMGLVIGFAICVVHWLISRRVKKIGSWDFTDFNVATIAMYSGWIGYQATQTSTILTGLIAGFFSQGWLRTHRPVIFKRYMFLVTAGWDGAATLVLFILSFAVLGAGGPMINFPDWWGNPQEGYPDHCPKPATS